MQMHTRAVSGATALILLATVYIGCEYGGRISSILLNVPGDAAAIMTALDGYPMAQQGRGGVIALGRLGARRSGGRVGGSRRVLRLDQGRGGTVRLDRKSTRLNSSHT